MNFKDKKQRETIDQYIARKKEFKEMIICIVSFSILFILAGWVCKELVLLQLN
jgi:hypothetical protein